MRIIGLLVGAMFVAHANAGSRQLGTGGGTTIEGAGGGGIVPWSVITGYGAREEHGFSGALGFVDVDDFELKTAAVAFGIRNRFEFSVARQEFDLITLGPALGIPEASLEQDIFGAKFRLMGDLIYTPAPQISIGLQHKRNRDFSIPSAVGALDETGTDFYVSAAKLWLAGAGGFNGFANATLRLTEANELGLLGFGGDRDNDHSLNFEGSAGVFLSRRTAIGVEYRQKPNNLSFSKEDDWWDVFVAWFPNRHFSVVAAYVDLGEIATLPGQNGFYLSFEGSF